MTIQQKIHDIMDKLANSLKGFEMRQSQFDFIHATSQICETQDAPNHIIAELPTGTGKSLGSLIPALAYQAATNQSRSKDDTIKVIYSTATVALQQQLLRDVSLLQAAGVPLKAHVVVGRSRFICLRNAKQVINPDYEQNSLLAEQAHGVDDEAGQLGIDATFETAVSEVDKTKIKKALAKLKDNGWSGIIDDLDRELTLGFATWNKVRAESSTCNRQCQYYNASCPFVRNRIDTADADLIITNHSMVFADLEKSHILPAPERSLHILDEGHHLVNNFHDNMIAKFSLRSIYEISTRHVNVISSGLRLASIHGDVTDKSSVTAEALQHVKVAIIPLMNSLDERYQQFAQTLPETEREKGVWRYNQEFIGKLGLLEAIHDIYLPLIRVRDNINAAVDALSDTELNPDETAALSNMAQHVSAIDAACSLCQLYLSDSPDNALWYQRHKSVGAANGTLFAAQINVANEMYMQFWKRVHKSIVMSATISNDNGFSNFNPESGLGYPDAVEAVFDTPFHDAFHYSSLHLYPDFPDPDWRQEQNHSNAIIGEVDRFMSYNNAGLLLMVSKRQLNQVVSLLPIALRDITLVQELDGSRTQIIEEHRRRIDAGERSLLIGLASFSEGLDLKQEYLTFVGIAKLSFGSFSEPRKQAEAEQIEKRGGNAFMELTLPHAEIALKQSVGRLIRSMECRGEIAIFDKRLLTKRYGAGLLQRLPNFYRELHTQAPFHRTG